MEATNNEGFIFGLDIGTRSIVGTVGYRVGMDRFIVVALESIEHTTRAVIDGQIHDIPTVARTISEIKKRLESRIHCDLTDVSIAAAGRVLKTKQVHAVLEFPAETKVTEDNIRSLDMLGVEQAYEEIRQDTENTEDEEKKFYCVGYSAAKYYLNGYPMEMLTMHSAHNIGVDLIATFLPDEVVDGLYEAVEEAGLHVASLTLEPIAAIQVAIPEKFRLLNIALVDVGAGTSDISIVKDGSIIAFGMIPLAGDEVTETIARNYLTDFETAEYVKRQCERRQNVSFKNIFGELIKVDQTEIEKISESAIDEITKNVASRIIELNGDKTVSAVFVVGGGGKHANFTQKLAKYLNLPENRVAIRGAEVLGNIRFEQSSVRKDSTLVTPIGICMNYYEQKSNFIHVTVNDQGVKLYDNGKATVLDACISSGFSQNNLFPIRGEELHYFVNGEERVVKGKTGEVAVVTKNGKEISLNEPALDNDVITIRPSTKGEDGHIMLSEIPESKKELTVTVFGKTVICPRMAEINGELASPIRDIQDQDKVEIFDYYSIGGLLEYADIEKEGKVLLNGREAGMAAKVYDGDVIEHAPEPPKKQEQEIEQVRESNESREKRVEKEIAKRVNNVTDKKQDGKEEKHEKQVKKEEEKGPRTLEEVLEKDPLLQPTKPLPEWMKDIPFDTAKLGPDGQVIPGVMDNRPLRDAPPAKEEKKTPELPARAIQVSINGKTYTMPKKANPIFVDVFDVFPFDMSKAGGTRLITQINGVDRDFTQPLSEGDEIEIYWEK